LFFGWIGEAYRRVLLLKCRLGGRAVNGKLSVSEGASASLVVFEELHLSQTLFGFRFGLVRAAQVLFGFFGQHFITAFHFLDLGGPPFSILERSQMEVNERIAVEGAKQKLRSGVRGVCAIC